MERVCAFIDNTAVRCRACQVKQIILSSSKALAGETPLCAGGQGVEGAALHTPCDVDWWTICTSWQKLVSIIQSVLFKGRRGKKKLLRANCGDGGKYPSENP